MAEKEEKGKAKPVRVQFGRESTAEDIVDAIDDMFDEAAKRNPKLYHEKYPDIYDEHGKRIRRIE